jgi:hypothetical protein
MKKIVAITLIVCLFTAASLIADPGIPDTVRVDSVSAMAGETVVLPVYFYNDEELSGVEIVFAYNDNNLSLDTFTLEGSRLESFENLTAILYDSNGVMDLLMFSLDTNINSGNGLLCNLHFTVKEAALPGNYLIDTTTRIVQSNPPTFTKTTFADTLAVGIYPQFVAGHINVVESPPVPDSVWVQHVTGSPGQLVNVEVYGYNSLLLDTLNLAFEYSSDDITYANTIFDGTRSSGAASNVVLVNTDIRQVLITINFSQAMPLDSGSGILAIMQFDIEADAAYGDVVIDSTRYLGAQSLEFSPLVGNSYTPYFTPGVVTISENTSVDDDARVALPTAYSLKQNYPNPFNPATEISFDLPRAGNVQLNVYNILGRKVNTLIDDYLTAGRHSVTFNGTADDGNPLASGIYLYRLITEEFVDSKKMTLMK